MRDPISQNANTSLSPNERPGIFPCGECKLRGRVGAEPRFDGISGARGHWHSNRMHSLQKGEHMDIIVTLLIGLAVGIVAKLLMPGRDPGGFIITTLLGIAGAFVARFAGERMGWYGPGDAVGFIAAVVGAMILLLLYRLLFRRKAVVNS